MAVKSITRDIQYYKFCLYGFFKNLRFFDAFLVLFLLEKGIGYFEIGLLYSVREIVIMIIEIPSGFIADALGRRKTLISSFFFYILSFLFFYLSTGIALVFVAMILFAIGDAFRTGVHKAMIFHYLKVNGWADQKVDYYGHTRAWSQAGSAFSALTAGIIVFFAGEINSVFIWSVIPYLLDMALIYSYPTWLDGELKQGHLLRIKAAFADVWKAFIVSLKTPATRRALLSTSLFSGYYSAIKDYIQPVIKAVALSAPVLIWLDNEQRTAVLIGVIYFFIYLLTSLASRLSGRINHLFSHPYKPVNLTLAAGFALGAVTFSFYYMGIYSIPILGFLLIMMIENLRKPMGIALVAEYSQNASMASVLSVSSQAKSLLAALLASVTGLLAEWLGLGSALAMVSFFLLVLYPFYQLKSKGNTR